MPPTQRKRAQSAENPPRKKPRLPNAERRQASIKSVLDAALTSFVTKGYDATSIDDIAAQAGLTKGAVYFYFKDKLALAGELLKRTEAELFDPIFNQLRAEPASATDRIVLLTNWMARMGAERIELPLLHVLLSLEFHGRNNAVESQINATYQRLHDELTEVVKDGQSSGEFSTELPANDQAAVLVAMIDGMLVEWHRNQDVLDGARLARSARALILNGIRRQPQREHSPQRLDSDKIVINDYDDFRQLEGKQILRSQPVEISAERIQQFCLGTFNDEWIHWDKARCEDSPLGDIIAPGLYLPALFPNMFWDAMEVNIPRIIVKGIDRIRILKPVTVGSRIVGVARVDKVLDKDPGIEVHYALTFLFADTEEIAAMATFINRYWE